jgi:hypothetical protein
MWGLDTVALCAEMRRCREAVLDLREGRIEAFDWGLKPELEVEGAEEPLPRPLPYKGRGDY